MKTIFSIILGLTICFTFMEQAEAQIPKGVSHYKLKNSGDLEKILAQTKDMNLTPAEMGEVSKLGMAIEKPGATFMTFDNTAPNYILTIGGVTIHFESGKTAPYEFLKTNGTALYDVIENTVKGKNTLGNGAVTEYEMVFKGKEVDVTRKTKSATVEFVLEQI